MILPLILGSAACLGLCILLLVALHNWAYKSGVAKGYEAGFAEGKVAGDNWWIRAESEVDQARVKIWREEASR